MTADRVTEVLAGLGLDPDDLDPDVLEALRQAAAAEDPVRTMTRRLFGRDDSAPATDDPPTPPGRHHVAREGRTTTPSADDDGLRRLTRELFGLDPDQHGGS